MTKAPPKKYFMRAHSKRRARERYGLTINSKTYKEIIVKIKSGDAEKLAKISNARYAYLVNISDKKIKVIYDRKRKELVTVLTEEMGI